jgi:autotransporter-associated beta strand protein
VSSGNNLGTFGILNGSATTLNILQDGGAGAVTLPTTADGNLFVTTGVGAINISAPIVNNTGALTLVKGGSSTLTLSGTNTYTGGTVLNAGTLAIGNVNNIGGASANLTFGGTATLAPSAALNFSTGTLTVNQGALATIANANSVTFATTTGAGTLAFSGSVAHNIGNASGLTGTLALLQASGTQSVQFSVLNGNTARSMLAFGGNANDSNQRSSFIFNGSSPLTFAAGGRQVAITPSTASNGGAKWNMLENNSTSAANTWVIESDLINTGVRSGISLVLAGSNTGNNAFNGAIGNSTLNNGSLWVAKNGAGKWILDGNNTFTGRLVVSQGTISVDTFNNADTAGPLGQGQIQLGGTTRADGANGNGPFGDNSGTLQYTGGAVTTSRTVIIGDNQAGNNGGGTIANDSTTGAMTFTAANFNASAGAITSTARTLTLAGTYTGGANEIQGVISNGTTSTGRLNVAKSGNATWLLSGDNTYTGTTAVNGGTLLINGDSSGATGNVTIASGATLGGSGTLGGATTVSGSIAPGNSIGTLNIANNVTWNGGNNWQFELGAGNSSDRLAITGNFNKGTGSVWRFDFLNSTALGTFTLATWTGTSSFAETDFSQINYDGPVAGSFSISGNSLLFTAIPEPSTALAGILLGLGLLRRRRSK